jgi:hypothetical protein
MGRLIPRAAMLAALAGAGMMLVACPRAPHADLAGIERMAADAIPSIEKGTGLRFKTKPKMELRTPEQIRQTLESLTREEQSPEEIEAEQFLFRRLGLIPDTLDLRKLMIDVLSEQVVGFYDPRAKTLYVRSDAKSDLLPLTVSHELVHALQDQYMNLDSVRRARHGDDDATLAFQAVEEGQAMLVPLKATLGADYSKTLAANWNQLRDQIRESRTGQPVFDEAPRAIKEILTFPYLSGADFMRRFGDAYPDSQPFGSALPGSTEQIMHSAAYFGAGRDVPLHPVLPPMTGATMLEENTLGEFVTRLYLFANLENQTTALRGSEGWGGDRYRIFRTAQGEGLTWLTLWDTQVDAADFLQNVQQLIALHYAAGQRALPGDAKAYDLPGRTLVLWAGEVAGHPAVLYEDVPKGTAVPVTRVEKVTVR